MAHFRKTVALTSLLAVLALSAVIYAQQDRLAMNVTTDVLRRTGAPNQGLSE